MGRQRPPHPDPNVERGRELNRRARRAAYAARRAAGLSPREAASGRGYSAYKEEHRAASEAYREQHPRREWATYALRAARKRARRKGVSCSISFLDLLELWDKQKGRCALSGEKLNPAGGLSADSPSVDRIQCFGNYELGNVRIVCYWANSGRQQQTDEEFVNRCQLVVSHQRKLFS